MSCFDKRVNWPGDRRNAVRQPIYAAGSAVSVEGSRSIILDNFCSRGAKILGRGLPSVGKQVLIWIEGLDVLGSIAWSRFGEHGVVFDEPLDLPGLANP